MGYTEQEIEMLVRFCDEAWPNERDNWPLIVSDALVSPSTDPVDMIICSAARLMREAAATRVDLNIEKTGEIRMTTGALDVLLREAREQGAAEMREIAALVAMRPDICPVDGPVAAERIRAVPLMPTTTNGNVNQGGDCAKCTVCGWSGRCPLPFESLPPKGACPSCGGVAVGISVPQ